MNKAIKTFIVCVLLTTICHTSEQKPFKINDIIYAKTKCMHAERPIEAGRLFRVTGYSKMYTPCRELPIPEDTDTWSKLKDGDILNCESRYDLVTFNSNEKPIGSQRFDTGQRVFIHGVDNAKQLVDMSMLDGDGTCVGQRMLLTVRDVAENFKKEIQIDSKLEAASAVSQSAPSPPEKLPERGPGAADPPADDLSAASSDVDKRKQPPSEISGSAASSTVPSGNGQLGNAPLGNLPHSLPTKPLDPPSAASQSDPSPAERLPKNDPGAADPPADGTATLPPVAPLDETSQFASPWDVPKLNKPSAASQSLVVLPTPSPQLDLPSSDSSAASASLSLTFLIGFAIAVFMAIN